MGAAGRGGGKNRIGQDSPHPTSPREEERMKNEELRIKSSIAYSAYLPYLAYPSYLANYKLQLQLARHLS